MNRPDFDTCLRLVGVSINNCRLICNAAYANPYLTAVSALPPGCVVSRWRHDWPMPDENWLRYRDRLVTVFSWAIPNEAAISAIAALGPVLEIGAGRGYWASLLRNAGVDVLAVDIEPYAATWTDVTVGGVEVAAEHHSRALMLCWPPFEDPMAADALEMYHGDTVIYVGEGAGGCTGDDAFFERLRAEFEQVSEVCIPRWNGINDYMAIYRRAARKL